MAIRRRSPVAQETTKRHRLRHPLLKHGTTTALVYHYVKNHPGATYSEMYGSIIRSGQPITDLVNQGLLRKVGQKRPFSYVAVPEAETGPGRDVLDIEVTVFVNKYGEYSISARMPAQKLTAHEDFPRAILTKEFKIEVPAPNEPFDSRDIVDMGDLQTFAIPQEADRSRANQPIVIDGDYTVIDG